ncbi:hypothetical protein DICPUDRAFT_22710, partial [Dictyostelium purpureum]
VVHVNDIKPFIEEDRNLFVDRGRKTQIPVVEEIDTIVNKRNRVYGKGSRIEYLIRYKNAGEDNDVWVPQHYLEDCPMLVRQFEDELA